MGITLSICQFHEIIGEMQEMIHAHFNETGYDNDSLKLDPDYDLYFKIEDANCLVCTAARNSDGLLIGYSIELIQPSLHHKGYVNAINDVLYVHPNYRGTHVPEEIIAFVGEYLKEMGVYLHQLTMTKHKNFGKLAAKCGYDPFETNWIKTLGA